MSVLDKDFVKQYTYKAIPWGYNGLGEIVFKRTYAREIEGENRKEEWFEAIERWVNGAQEIGAQYTEDEAQRIYDYMFNLKGLYGGRALWQLGTELARTHAGSLVNCAYTDIETIDDVEFIFNMLMLGCGAGFSVERAQIHEFPKVKFDVKITHERTSDADIIVPDSREGWGRLLHAVLKSFFFTGKSFTYSTILVRGYGAPLKKFGGTASGPQALIDGIEDICKVLSARAGKKTRSVDILDVVDIIGRIVVSGSSRRSALISLGDPDDFLFLRAKNWGRGNIPDWRVNSNNSLYCDSYDEVVDEIWKGYNGTGEPYGLVNRKLARSQGRLGELVKDDVKGYNPCAEIPLSSKETCNLASVNLPSIKSKDELLDVSELLYKCQKAITSLQYPHPATTAVVRKNRRLGQSITGWLQATDEQLSWVPDAYDSLRTFDAKWSAHLRVPESIKLTTVQPDGTKGLMFGSLPGVHAGMGRFHIRRVQLGSQDPLVDYCRDRGYPIEYRKTMESGEDHTRVVVSFPCESPPNAVQAKDMTAIQQLEWVVRAQTDWADNAVSVTIKYKLEELPEIQTWLKKNYDTKIKSVSFLLHEDHGFVQAPYEEITEEEYQNMLGDLKDIDYDILSSELLEISCEGGACPVR